MPPKKSKSKDKKSKKKEDKSKESKGKISSRKSEPKVNDENAPKVGGEFVCVQHNSNLIYFCESCEEPVCQLCTTLGPHNNQVKKY